MISKDDILKKINQETIIEYYFPYKIVRRRKYINPFRQDKNPGCTFRYSTSGVLYFTDWAINENYDCFRIASLTTGIENFQDLCKRINKDLNLNLMPTSLKIPKKMNITVENKKDYFKENPKVSITSDLKDFSKSDLDYWNSQKIDKRTLEKFNVRSVDRLYVGDNIFENTEVNPIFKYSFEDNQSQYYLPYNKYRFFSNKIPYYLMGYENLPHVGKEVIITSSFKDVMQWSQINIPAIAPDSESSGVKREDLIRLFKRFDNIYINFDNDEAGIKATNELLKKFSDFPLRYFFTMEAKDPTELVIRHGKKSLINQFNNGKNRF